MESDAKQSDISSPDPYTNLYFKINLIFQTLKPRLVTISVLGVTAIVLSQWERFAKPEYRTMRAGVFLSLGLSGVIPMLHTIIKNGTKGNKLLFILVNTGRLVSFGEGQIHWLILMALLYIFGAVFYATRFPECVWPGRFDLVFQSHQIFHIFVVVAALIHMYGISNLQFYRWQQGQTCTPLPQSYNL